MRFTKSSTISFFFPFQPKRIIRFSWITLVPVIFCLTVFAANNSQQTKADNSRQLQKQADKLTRKGNLPEAENILRQLVLQDSANVKAKLALSYVLLKQKKLIPSYNISFDVAKADPKNSRALALLGTAFLNLGSFKEAAILLNNAAAIDNKESLAWAGLGLLDFYENRIDESVGKLETATYINYNEPDFIFSLAQIYARAEKYSNAAEAYDRFLQIAPLADEDRRDRIKGLIAFLRFLGGKQKLYEIGNESKQTTVPLEISRDRPIIEVTANGKADKLRFVLDTGSGISVISEETAKKLNIKAISRGGMARAIGGSGKFEIVYGFLRTINIGDVKVNSIPVYIRKFHDNGEQIDGYIGLSLISKFLTTVDYGNSTFTLIKKNQASADLFAKESKETIALPLRLTSSGFLSGEVQLHGVESPLNFIVDTGASISVVSDALATLNHFGKFSINERMRVVGAAGITENVQSFMIPKVSFGNHSRESLKAIALDLGVINETSGFEQSGILGGNFLKNYRLTFDFQNSKVIFVPVNK